MRYQHVCLQSAACLLPDEAVTTADLESRLAPVYDRLRLPEGRLELMTGIRERRFFPRDMLPSTGSIEAGRRALAAAGVEARQIGLLVHGSVCRDHLEPATAAAVHDALGLPADCMLYDVSNACLGLLNGAVQAANMIELGQIEAALVVGSENGRALVEGTIDWLNRTPRVTREDVKLAIASLTIGSAACGLVLMRRKNDADGRQLVAAVARANTNEHRLCESGQDEAGTSFSPLMRTDSERLMHAGVALGAETFEALLQQTGWQREEIAHTFCHQVGVAHRRMMLSALQLPAERDFALVETLGNTGSSACPTTLAVAIEQGRLKPGEKFAMLGIGSGINCLMLAAQW